MKKLLYVLYSTLCFLHSTFFFVIPTLGGISSAFAQVDSIRITHTQEAGTLEKQRFIDQYDYVFMTKEPTKWMGKIFTNLSHLENPERISSKYLKNNTDLRLGLEHKITPSFSIAFDVARNQMSPFRKSYFYDQNPSKSYIYAFGLSQPEARWVTSAEIRWYYDMANRITKRQSGNNFSGNYISLRYERTWQQEEFSSRLLSSNNDTWETDYFAQYYKQQINLSYGIQRRFFQNGLADFSISLNRSTDQIVHRKLNFLDESLSIKQPIDWGNIQESISFSPDNNWSITTNFKLGIAFADLKISNHIPHCEVYQCLVNEASLLKLSWPQLRLSPFFQSLKGSVGFEQKLFQSSFSLNTYLDYSLSNYQSGNIFTSMPSGKFSFVLSNFLTIQPRWYFLMKHFNRLGKTGNNLSGPYIGLSVLSTGAHGSSPSNKIVQQYCSTGFLLGFQQKLFKKGFFDINLAKPFHESKNSITSIWNKQTIFDFKLGFAL